MALNNSGAISLGGTTAGQSIAIENGGPGTAQISLNDAAVRSLAGVPTGVIVMPTDFYGKSNQTIINLTVSANTKNYDVYNNRGPTYTPGNSNITVTINPGVFVGSNPGAYALLVPSAFSPTDIVTIVNNGTIIGVGGSGGNGKSPVGAGASGGNPGGNAIYVNRPTTITNNGTVAGGGGGGGGGGSGGNPGANPQRGGGGGGGGAGFDGGGGGAGGPGPFGTVGGSGSPGNPTAGGAGGGGASGIGGPGGNGGGQGAAGATGNAGNGPTAQGGAGGGGAGAYITGSPFVTWPATGTRLGNTA